MGHAKDHLAARPRCIALVGPFQSGKTALLEAILERTGAIKRAGTSREHNRVGDQSDEAGKHAMSVELNIAETEFMGDPFTFIDCPGSIEFSQDMRAALSICDAAIVVCEADDKKLPSLKLLLKQIEDLGIPHVLFLNKIDKLEGRVRDVLPLMQPASSQPLVLRQIPIWQGEEISGFVDLALGRAFSYQPHATSSQISMPEDIEQRHSEARTTMLEQLADFDDELLEQLLEDVSPERGKVFEDLTNEMARGEICPVFLGAAENGNGLLRLLKMIRHECPDMEQTLARLDMKDLKGDTAHIFKTLHTSHGGKISLGRVLSGGFKDGAPVFADAEEVKISGLYKIKGQEPAKLEQAAAGSVAGFGKLEPVATGGVIWGQNASEAELQPISEQSKTHAAPAPVYGVAVSVSERKDEVKLTSALAKIIEEDPSLTLEHHAEMSEMVLSGQGEMHLRVALERLARKYGLSVHAANYHIPYRETIRKGTQVRGRYKKQSGGHGQFGDVKLTIEPQPRGSGFTFSDTITGGVVPKQYIPSVEAGVKDYLTSGPLGFPLVDIAVCLTDGSYHSVDSSDQAFRSAGRVAMVEGVPECAPVLLEPVMAVDIFTPSDATAKVNAIISGRRGQILGFEPRAGWDGWDVVQAYMPQADMQDLIIELRSATAGVASFKSAFDHLAELTGKRADQVLATHRAEAA